MTNLPFGHFEKEEIEMYEELPITLNGRVGTSLEIASASALIRYPGGPEMAELALGNPDAFLLAYHRMLDDLAMPGYFNTPLAERPAIRTFSPHEAISREEWYARVIGVGATMTEMGRLVLDHQELWEYNPQEQRVVLALGSELLIDGVGWRAGGLSIFSRARAFGLVDLSISAGPLLIADSISLKQLINIPLAGFLGWTVVLQTQGTRMLSSTAHLEFKPDKLYAFGRL